MNQLVATHWLSFSEGSAEGAGDVTLLLYSCQNFLFLLHLMLSTQSEEELGKKQKRNRTDDKKCRHITV